MKYFDTFNDPCTIKFHSTKHSITSWLYPGGQAGNHYEKSTSGVSTSGFTGLCGLSHIRVHQDWQDNGSMQQKLAVLFGSTSKYQGDEHIQRYTYQHTL